MPSQSLGALLACQFIESTTVDALETDLIARLEQARLWAIGVKHPPMLLTNKMKKTT